MSISMNVPRAITGAGQSRPASIVQEGTVARVLRDTPSIKESATTLTSAAFMGRKFALEVDAAKTQLVPIAAPAKKDFSKSQALAKTSMNARKAKRCASKSATTFGAVTDAAADRASDLMQTTKLAPTWMNALNLRKTIFALAFAKTLLEVTLANVPMAIDLAKTSALVKV